MGTQLVITVVEIVVNWCMFSYIIRRLVPKLTPHHYLPSRGPDTKIVQDYPNQRCPNCP